MTDIEDYCLSSLRNCSADFPTDNAYNYMTCPWDTAKCGWHAATTTWGDSEHDGRFGDNYILARDDIIDIATGSTFD